MINWKTFDWDTFEAYIAHFQESTIPANYHDVGTSLEIALELASGGELERKIEDTYYDLFKKIKRKTKTVQAKKSKGDSIILRNGRGESKTKLLYADYYVICNYDTRTLYLINGDEIKRVVEETEADKNKDVCVNITSCKKEIIWSGQVWKTLSDSSHSWFKKKHDAFYDLWYTCKNNVKQQSPLGAFIK